MTSLLKAPILVEWRGLNHTNTEARGRENLTAYLAVHALR